MKAFELWMKYIRCNMGVAAIWFGMTVPMVVSAVGVSLDLGQTYLVRERLSHALDAAALAAAALASEDADVVEQKVNDFIEANYPPDKVGFTIDTHVENHADTLYVNATARLDTAFLKVVGKDYIDVFAEAEVTKEVKAIEVALVMDITGSMSTMVGSKTRIQLLIEAAKLFVNTMFERVGDINDLKIGLVPFSTSVNVGTYGLGKTPTGLTYDTPFVNNPSNLAYSTTDSNKWGGCIIEDYYPKDTLDHVGPWNMYRYCRTSTGAAIPNCNTTKSGSAPNYVYTVGQAQNYNCTKSSILPLTNNKTELLTRIGAMKAEGSTYINVGLVWGLRMISPEFPLQEAEPWSDTDWKKAVIVMTDGVNEAHTHYSGLGLSKDTNHDGQISSAESSLSVTQIEANSSVLNDRMLDVCDELRDKKVLVYTITFDNGVSTATKKLFEKCATQPNMYYDAPDGTKLKEVYLTIAKELANLHLSK